MSKNISNLSCDQIYEIWRTEPELIELLDLRPSPEYQAFHIPGAKNVPYNDHFFSNYNFSEQKLTVLLCPGFEDEVKDDYLKSDAQDVEIAFMNKCHEWLKNGKPLTGKSINKIQETMNRSPIKNNENSIIFYQIHNSITATYSYILGDTASKEIFIIDPQVEILEQILEVINKNDLKLLYCLSTTSPPVSFEAFFELRKTLHAKIAIFSKQSNSDIDIQLEDGQELLIGNDVVFVIVNKEEDTTKICYYFRGMLNTSALVINSDKLKQLPANTKIYQSNNKNEYSIKDFLS